MFTVRIVVEQHEGSQTTYPFGDDGVVLGEGDSYHEALAVAKSAIAVYIETIDAQAQDGVEDTLSASDPNARAEP